MSLQPIARLARTPWFSVLAVLLLALGGNAVSAAHWLLVPHRLCEVHRTWEHASAIADTHSAPESVPTYHDAGSSHEECALATLARPEPLSESTAEQGAARPQGVRAARIVHPTDRRAPIPPLFLAPKHSPPV